MGAPQIVMMMIIIWQCAIDFLRMSKADKTFTQFTGTIIAVVLRCGIVVGVLAWGNFWN